MIPSVSRANSSWGSHARCIRPSVVAVARSISLNALTKTKNPMARSLFACTAAKRRAPRAFKIPLEESGEREGGVGLGAPRVCSHCGAKLVDRTGSPQQEALRGVSVVLGGLGRLSRECKSATVGLHRGSGMLRPPGRVTTVAPAGRANKEAGGDGRRVW